MLNRVQEIYKYLKNSIFWNVYCWNRKIIPKKCYFIIVTSI